MKKLIVLILAVMLLLACAIPAQAADSRKAEAAAVLYDLGLFQGTGTNADGTPDFSLDRAAKRAEGVTLLVRLLGIDEETLKNASGRTVHRRARLGKSPTSTSPTKTT